MTRYEIETLSRILAQIVLDVAVMSAIVYFFHFVFAYPSIWVTFIVIFSVLIRTGWWKRMEDAAASRGKNDSTRL